MGGHLNNNGIPNCKIAFCKYFVSWITMLIVSTYKMHYLSVFNLNIR
jgi:hypothetical protein